jgi:chemotaxis response regulator CheB
VQCRAAALGKPDRVPGRRERSYVERIADQNPARPHVAVALGASAGGVEAISTVIEGLPKDLPAAVLVVLHIAPIGPSVLPAIISARAKLPASHAYDGQELETGHVYVALPDRA